MIKVNICLIMLLIATIARVLLHVYTVGPEKKRVSLVESPVILTIHSDITSRLHSYLPSPHSELLLGMTIGADLLNYVPIFKDASIKTGTIHVLVVSGFNISLVFSLVISVLGSRYRLRNLVVAQIFTLVYSILTGFEPPVVRAWTMGSLVSWGKYYGRGLPIIRVLLVACLVMLLVSPGIIFSKSFHLSFLATFSLIRYSPVMKKMVEKFIRLPFIREDLISTLAAQVLVWPYISYSFGRVSLSSFVVNPLILWTVPISTILGICLIISSYISRSFTNILAYIAYPFLDIFIRVVNFFAQINFSSVSIKLTLSALLIYYSILFLCELYFISR